MVPGCGPLPIHVPLDAAFRASHTFTEPALSDATAPGVDVRGHLKRSGLREEELADVPALPEGGTPPSPGVPFIMVKSVVPALLL